MEGLNKIVKNKSNDNWYRCLGMKCGIRGWKAEVTEKMTQNN
jgi:hypothetical protein